MKPPPATPARLSGRFVLRIDPGLHACLRRDAAGSGLSLNDFCARKLAAPLGSPLALGPGAAVLARALSLHGDDLVGVALFGSWARGEAVPGSDADLLVVLAEGTRLTRALYRAWDDEALAWDSHPVAVQLAALPAAGSAVGGLWAEVALDGIVLFERELLLSRRLGALRREVLSGRLVRKTVQGQPYWVRVA